MLFVRALLNKKHYYILCISVFTIALIPFLIRGEYHEKIVDAENEWNMEFKSSIIPIFDESYQLNVSGNLNGKAILYLFASQEHQKPFKQVEIGPGIVTFTSSAPEYWCPTLYIEYKPLSVTEGELNVHATLR